MPFHLAAGLTLEAASRVCMHECRAGCCRGPLVLRLTAAEAQLFRTRALELGVELKLREAGEGSGQVAFLEHPGDHCPMLDDATSACRIYQERPARCRDFPDAPRPDCPISGSVADRERRP
jgi:Fe-S-cluster containining protein